MLVVTTRSNALTGVSFLSETVIKNTGENIYLREPEDLTVF